TVPALALCIALAACNQPAAAPAADPAAAIAAIKAAEADLLAAFKAKDAKKVTEAYAPTADILNPGAPVQNLAEAAKILDDPAFTIDFTNTKTDVAASADLGYTRGTFKVTFTNPGTKKVETVEGNYVTVFRKQDDGSWKAVQDIATPGPEKG